MAPQRKRVVKKTQPISKATESKQEMTSVSHIPTQAISGKQGNRKTTIIVAIVLVLAALFYLFRNYIVAATVNGQMISKLTLYQELDKQYGKQVLDTLMTKVIIQQEATKRKISVTEEDINNELTKIETRFTSQGQNLDDVLKSQGYSKDDLKDQVRLQIMVEKMVVDKVQVTDEEVTKYITDNKEYLPKDKSEEELKTIAQDSVRQEKVNQEVQALMSELKDKATIVPASLKAAPSQSNN
jgi:foldase protein PrsA